MVQICLKLHMYVVNTQGRLTHLSYTHMTLHIHLHLQVKANLDMHIHIHIHISIHVQFVSNAHTYARIHKGTYCGKTDAK